MYTDTTNDKGTEMKNYEALAAARAMYHDGRLTAGELRDVEMFVLDFDLNGGCAKVVVDFLRSKE